MHGQPEVLDLGREDLEGERVVGDRRDIASVEPLRGVDREAGGRISVRVLVARQVGLDLAGAYEDDVAERGR